MGLCEGFKSAGGINSTVLAPGMRSTSAKYSVDGPSPRYHWFNFVMGEIKLPKTNIPQSCAHGYPQSQVSVTEFLDRGETKQLLKAILAAERP